MTSACHTWVHPLSKIHSDSTSLQLRVVLSALLTRSERNYSVLAQGLMKRHRSGNPRPDSPKTVNSKSSSPSVAASFATMSLPTRPDCPAEDGIAAARNKAGARDAACGTLFLLLICTGIYSWFEPMVHYFTKLSYILCILLGGNQQTAPKSPRLGERKDALRSHPFSKDIHGGCSPPSPVLRSSHGPSGPPTCSQHSFLPESFSSRRRTFCWRGRRESSSNGPHSRTEALPPAARSPIAPTGLGQEQNPPCASAVLRPVVQPGLTGHWHASSPGSSSRT